MITQPYTVLTPAYGRDYTQAKEIEYDLRRRLDFIRQPSGEIVNLDDLAPGLIVNLRFSKNSKIHQVTI